MDPELITRSLNISFSALLPVSCICLHWCLLKLEAGDLGHSPAPQTAALLINARWLAVYCMATLAECRRGFRHCKSEQLALGLPPPASLNAKQTLSRYAWAQSQVLHYSPGSFVCYLSSLLTLLRSLTHHLSLTAFSWLYCTSSHLWSWATLSPVHLHYSHLKIYCSELRPILYGWLRRCLLVRRGVEPALPVQIDIQQCVSALLGTGQWFMGVSGSRHALKG